MLYRSLPRIFLGFLVLTLIGCATYYQPRYGQDGVYYDDPRSHTRSSVYVGYYNPMFYPYWSLDYFYFSRHYHPYSVRIHYYDPWYYPYPGWYYGYRPGPRSHFAVGWGRTYYPWHGYGYHYYRPWRPHYVHYPKESLVEAPHIDRVRLIDERMRHAERRERAAATRSRAEGVTDPSRAVATRREIPRATRTSDRRDARTQRERSDGLPTRPIPRQRPPEQSRQQVPREIERSGGLEPRSSERIRSDRGAGQPSRRAPPPQSPPRTRSSGESAPSRQQRSSPPQRRSSSPQRQRSGESRSSQRSRRSEPPSNQSERRLRRRD